MGQCMDGYIYGVAITGNFITRFFRSSLERESASVLFNAICSSIENQGLHHRSGMVSTSMWSPQASEPRRTGGIGHQHSYFPNQGFSLPHPTQAMALFFIVGESQM